MPFVQETYSENIPVTLPGTLADEDHSVDTYVVETEAGIGFGLACSQGTEDHQTLLGSASAALFIGISVKDKTVPGAEELYPDQENIGIMYRGDIWVTTGGVVNVGDDVTFVASTGVLSSEATSGTQFAISGARWMTSASSGGLAKVRLSGSLPSA